MRTTITLFRCERMCGGYRFFYVLRGEWARKTNKYEGGFSALPLNNLSFVEYAKSMNKLFKKYVYIHNSV